MELLAVFLVVAIPVLFAWLSFRFGADSRDTVSSPAQGFFGDGHRR